MSHNHLHSSISDDPFLSQKLYASTEQQGFASDTDLIGVLGFLPSEGEVGCPITARIQFSERWNHKQKVSVRLVVADKPVATEVIGDAMGTYKLDAAIPYLSSDLISSFSNKVPLSVQVLDAGSQNVLDQLTFGDFSYWTSERAPFPVARARSILESNEPVASAPQIPSNLDPNSRRCSVPSLPSFSSIMQRTQVERRSRGKSMIAGRSKNAEEDPISKISLEIVTPLNTMCENWSFAEQQASRRLVKVRRLQAGSKVVLSCEPLSQEEYVPEEESSRDCIVSCIYFEETGKYFVTSVDVIYLLQRITNHPGPFPTDEKNRIRRNMEALRPTVVAKTKGCEVLFSLIMNFPDPKPRNIEKDIKVFEWTSLGQALERVLSKYSMYSLHTLPPSTSGQDTGFGSSSSSSKLDDIPMSLPSQHETGPTPYIGSSSIVPKHEMVEPSLYRDAYLPTSDGAEIRLKRASVHSYTETPKDYITGSLSDAMGVRRSLTSDSIQSSSDGWPSGGQASPVYRDYGSVQQYPVSPSSPMHIDAPRDPYDGWGSAMPYDPVRSQH